MLILTRRHEESIVLWDDAGLKIGVTVLQGHGNQIRLAFDAPKNVHIDRHELYIKKQLEKVVK